MSVALVSHVLGQPEERNGPGSVPARPVCARRPFGPGLGVAAVLMALSWALAPSVAAGAACPSLDTSYIGNCGPQFSVPNWTDVGGWTDQSKYSTIQLADVNGDGTDELIGRADDGIEIFWFDTTLGQWRPQVDSGGVRQVLTDFASPPPWEAGDPHSPAEPQYYSTIQAANVDGQPGAEILARFWDGMRVYQYSGPEIDGGTWTRIGTGGPFSDADGYGDPSLYSTIQVGYFSSKEFPTLFARQHSQPGDPSLAFYSWQNGAWSRLPDPTKDEGYVSGFSDQECGQPSCYLNLKAADAFGDPFGEGLLDDVLGRNPWGVSVFTWDYFNDAWDVAAGGPGVVGAFADVFASPDCPFGGSGTGAGDCLGSSPSYYETLGAADLDGGTGPHEFFARASDGLRVYTFDTDTVPPDLDRLPTLTALASGGLIFDFSEPGHWGSIRTADIDADGKDEVLALDGYGLQAWSYDPASRTWRQFQPSTPLALGADPWLTHPEYYATIQTGDVDGDGRDDVVARGPSGIRTWFYDRRGTGGWERYLPEGYPGFAGAQQNAFQALTELAKTNQVIPQTAASMRDVWASENAPQQSDLDSLQRGLVSIANCSGPGAGNPPRYQACTPPAGTSGFTPADWTTVVNQLLAENYAAGEVLAFFAQLDDMRESLFIAEGAELPAIGHDLGMQAAAGSTAQFNVLKFISTALGIAGSVAGTADPEAGAPLSVAAYVLSAIPAGSPLANSTFETTYAGLQDQFAQMVTEVDKAMLVQSYEVRNDAGLLGLVGQLRSSGAWALDTIGVESAASQGFALWAYSVLLPTFSDGYRITNCYDGFENMGLCSGPPNPRGTDGSNCGPRSCQDFNMAGQQYQKYSVPCHNEDGAGEDPYWVCIFYALPDDIMNRIWDPMPADCIYQPGNPETAWTFGCPAGDDVRMSVGRNAWGFNSYCGNYVAQSCSGAAVGAGAARARRGAPIRLGRPGYGRRRAVRGRARLRAEVHIHPRLALAGATVRLDRLLFEPRGRGELTHPRGKRVPRPLTLRRTGPGRFSAVARSGRRRARVVMRRVGRRRASLTLTAGAAAFQTPRACHALPAGVAIETPPLELETRLLISDGRRTHPVVLRHPMRCRRDARGNISTLAYVHNRPRRLRPGLALTLRGPRRVQPGTTARYVARVQNRRRGGDRLLSSLWGVTLTGGTRSTRIGELRAGRSRRVVFTVRVPRAARGRLCTRAVAGALGARAALGRVCSRIQAAGGPVRVTG